MAKIEIHKDTATWGPVDLSLTASGVLSLESTGIEYDLVDNYSYLIIQYYNDPNRGDFFVKAHFSTNSDDPNSAIIKIEYFNEEGGLERTISDVYLTASLLSSSAVDLFSGNDQFYLSNQNDTASAASGNDLIWGYDGNDYLAGQGGNDTLWGGSGYNFLDGGSGEDTAQYIGTNLSYTITGSSEALVILDNSGENGDFLKNIENLVFYEGDESHSLTVDQAINNDNIFLLVDDISFTPQRELALLDSEVHIDLDYGFFVLSMNFEWFNNVVAGLSLDPSSGLDRYAIKFHNIGESTSTYSDYEWNDSYGTIWFDHNNDTYLAVFDPEIKSADFTDTNEVVTFAVSNGTSWVAETFEYDYIAMQDVTAPILSAMYINAREFTEGDTIKGSITASDASGIAYADIEYLYPTGDYNYLELTDPDGDGTFTNADLIDASVPEGSYLAKSIFLRDASSNQNSVEYRDDGSVYVNGSLQSASHTFDFAALNFDIVDSVTISNPSFDVTLASTSGSVATFEVYATAAADSGGLGLDDFQFVLSHDIADMTIDASSFGTAVGLSAVPNLDQSSGILTFGGFALPPFTALATPILTFDATILNEDAPFSIIIDNIIADDTNMPRVVEEFDFSSVEVESTVVGRGGQALSDVRVSYDFVTPSGKEQSIELPAHAASKVSQVMPRGSDVTVTADGNIDVASDKAITANDALQALRLAVGLTKSDGKAEWHDYLAADINKDGQVTANDALNILKFAVGLTDGPSADWIFVDGDADWSAIGRRNTGYEEGVWLEDVVADMSVNMTAILVGDVNGSYVV